MVRPQFCTYISLLLGKPSLYLHAFKFYLEDSLKILGVRNAPKQFRYALVFWDGQNASLLNANKENLIKMPTGIDEVSKQLYWLYQELNRVMRQNSDITCIALKANEYGRGSESANSRTAAYFDGVVNLVAGQNNVPVICKLYRQIGTKRNEVLQFSENKLGKTEYNWNHQMADAVATAWSAISEVR